MKNILTTILLFAGVFLHLKINAQNNYEDGYALRGIDTITCKLMRDKQEKAMSSVKLLIAGEEITFFPGGPVSSFGLSDPLEDYHFGTLKIDATVAGRKMTDLYYVRKLATGRVEFYEYTYLVYTTRRSSVNGVQQSGSSSTSQTHTQYYISKRDTLLNESPLPKLVTSYRSKDLEHYFSDQPALFARAQKHFTGKQLLAFIKEYNSLFATKE